MSPAIRLPGALPALQGVLGFLGVTALGGGVEMLAFRRGNQYLPPPLLDKLPVSTFTLPGAVLGGAFGIGSLATVIGLRRRPHVAAFRSVEAATGQHWSWTAAVGLGVGFTAWMGTEVALLGPPWAAESREDAVTAAVLEGVYGSVALALLILPWRRSVREALTVRETGSPA